MTTLPCFLCINIFSYCQLQYVQILVTSYLQVNPLYCISPQYPHILRIDTSINTQIYILNSLSARQLCNCQHLYVYYSNTLQSYILYILITSNMKLFAIFSALVISLGTCLRRDQYYAQAHLLDVPTPSATTLPSTNPTAQTVTPSPQTSQQQPAKPKVDQSKYKSFEECCAGNGNFQCGRMFKDCCKTKPNSKTNNTCDGAVVKNCPAGQYFDQCDFLKK